MNEEGGSTGGTDMDEAPVLDPQGAAAILQQARDRAQRELAVRRPVLFLIWAVAVFAGVVGGLAVYALAGGVGIALMAVIEPRLRRS